MRRTLLAIGIAVLVSMMLVPRGASMEMYERLPFFVSSSYAVAWPAFILQTIFVFVGAAVLVNLRGPRK
jgi:cellobiose-specific phosphotransferase system component IIC